MVVAQAQKIEVSGDSVTFTHSALHPHPSRLRITVTYQDIDCNPKQGVPPESIQESVITMIHCRLCSSGCTGSATASSAWIATQTERCKHNLFINSILASPASGLFIVGRLCETALDYVASDTDALQSRIYDRVLVLERKSN